MLADDPKITISVNEVNAKKTMVLTVELARGDAQTTKPRLELGLKALDMAKAELQKQIDATPEIVRPGTFTKGTVTIEKGL